MTNKALHTISIAAGISLLGILITQATWLKKTHDAAQKQFNHRANQMLEDVVNELQTYADTSSVIAIHNQTGNLHFYDVVDTLLLKNLIQKYAIYHTLDTVFHYALVITESTEIIHRSEGFEDWHENESYMVCLSCIWKKEYIHLSVFFPNKDKSILSSLIIWMLLSVVFTLATIGALILILFTVFRQKKIAEIKNDFVNNMTHELKTPISTISVASEVLMQLEETNLDKRLKKYSKIIFDENQRMRKLVDKVLNIATLDKTQPNLDIEEVNMHTIICKTVNSFCLEANKQDVKIDYQLMADRPIVLADTLHMRNVINNLLDNAIKYSVDAPEITISTQNSEGYLLIKVADKGIGIAKESINKVFDKFYRVPEGNVHNVKGFGLGLFYVKAIVEAHQGMVTVHSTPGSGSVMEIYIPQ
ncbi:MAG: HAMP domain-containing histidine kinase [Bacteroidota bacterium]|nr:MAG: HAMP domain-containing histidine kinase [Bacteroidota bacterium]